MYWVTICVPGRWITGGMTSQVTTCAEKGKGEVKVHPITNNSVKRNMGGPRGRLRLKCDGTRAENRCRLSAKRTSPFKSAGGGQFSRLLAAEVCASAVVMLDTPCSEVVWRVLATHSIRQFPLHFPWVTVCHHISTGLYKERFVLPERDKK